MMWTGNVAGMGKREMRIGYWWESQREEATRKTRKWVGGLYWDGSCRGGKG
jgi:hypothetical protein